MFQVQEFAAGKWWPVRSFETEVEAIEFKNQLGHKTRIIKTK